MSEVRYPVQPYDRVASTRVSQLVGGLSTTLPSALAGTCDLVFAAGASTLAGSAGALVGTNAAAMVFGSAADLTGVSATIDLPILVMAPRLA